MARSPCARSAPGEVPKDGGTAVQEDPDRPVFRGNGPNDYVCVSSAATCSRSAMDPDYMDFKVRVRCGRCGTVNVAENDDRTPEERAGAVVSLAIA